MKKLFISVGLIILYASMAHALKPNKITYMNDRYDKNGKQTSSGGLIRTAGLGCFDEESCAFLAKAVEENPKLKPYTDYIGTDAKPIIGRIDPGGALQDTGERWPEGTLIAGQDDNFLHERCFVSFNTDKDMKTIIGIELMNSSANSCDL